MAGITAEGFVTQRAPEILQSLRNEAVLLFQELVPVGDIVDVSDSSTLGRLIGLVTPSLTDLWEAAQESYSAFDPNTATGIALDNLVAIGGISRQEETASTASMLFSGDNGTLLSTGLVVGSTVDATQWELISSVALSPTLASGCTVTVLSAADSTDYTITYASGTTSNTITYTSGVSATAATILSGLNSAIQASHPSLSSEVVGTTLVVNRVDEFSVVSFTTSTNLGITKVVKVGEVRCTENGDIEAEVNSLTTILTPQLGLDSVTNPLPASVGTNRETDEELRERFRNTKFERATNIIEALYSALISVSGVSEVIIYENDTDDPDSNGIPAHSFMPIVVGGSSADIANTIWQNKPMGITSHGSTSVVILDSQGLSHTIRFERPDPITIYITIDLTTDVLFPATGVNDIKSALIQYFEDNIGVGDDVIYSRLYTPINSVAGHQVDGLFIGTSPSPVTSSNIAITFDQIATLSSDNIVINT